MATVDTFACFYLFLYVGASVWLLFMLECHANETQLYPYIHGRRCVITNSSISWVTVAALGSCVARRYSTLLSYSRTRTVIDTSLIETKIENVCSQATPAGGPHVILPPYSILPLQGALVHLYKAQPTWGGIMWSDSNRSSYSAAGHTGHLITVINIARRAQAYSSCCWSQDGTPVLVTQQFCFDLPCLITWVFYIMFVNYV